IGAWSIALRFRSATDGERLLLLWVTIGSLELLLHDVSNERRFVFLLPAFAAFAAVSLSGDSWNTELRQLPLLGRIIALPLVLYSAYVVVAPVVRLLFLDQVRNHVLHSTVQLSTILAVSVGLTFAVNSLIGKTGPFVWRRRAAAAALVALLGWGMYQFTDYARARTWKNYEAMLALGRAVPPETLIQGKLANGLDLENRVRPIFIGHAFGNYADRFRRDDVRYILSYTVPKLGYEGSQIEEVLAASP